MRVYVSVAVGRHYHRSAARFDLITPQTKLMDNIVLLLKVL